MVPLHFVNKSMRTFFNRMLKSYSILHILMYTYIYVYIHTNISMYIWHRLRHTFTNKDTDPQQVSQEVSQVQVISADQRSPKGVTRAAKAFIEICNGFRKISQRPELECTCLHILTHTYTHIYLLYECILYM